MGPLIRIDLERPDGVYFAGEVVRGTVTIKAPGLKCKGVFLSFKGFSHVHWIARFFFFIPVDVIGKSKFQEQCPTLYGNHFNTGILERAGKDARFDRVPNSGILYIPCDLSEEERFKLIVRVNDYEWGKHNDLLGELLLDVPELVFSETEQTYPLMRNGGNDRGSVTLSAKFLPYEAVFPTQSRSGVNVSTVVKKPLCLVLRVHEALGLREAHPYKKNNVYVQAYRPPEIIGITSKSLPKPEKMFTLPDEELTLPFALQLRTDAPGSAEFPKTGIICHVRYTLRAYIHSTRWINPSVKRMLHVIPNRPLPKMSLLAPARIEILDYPIYYRVLGWKCCKISGSVSAKVYLERLAYAPGEKVCIAGQIVNDTTKPMPFSLTLRLDVLMLSFIPPAGYALRRVPRYFDLFQSTVPARSSVSLQELAGIDQARIPAVFPSFDGGVPKPYSATSYPCLRWSYTVEVHVGGRRGSRYGLTAVHSRLPILICSAPPYQHAMEAARDQDMPPITMTNFFDFLAAHTATDLEGCDTAPTITSPENSGVVVEAQLTGEMNAFKAYEDAYIVDGNCITSQW